MANRRHENWCYIELSTPGIGAVRCAICGCSNAAIFVETKACGATIVTGGKPPDSCGTSVACLQLFGNLKKRTKLGVVEYRKGGG